MATQTETITETLKEMGVSLTSHLVKDNFDGRMGETEWSVTVNFVNGPITSPYSMGCAHRHYGRLSGEKPGTPIKLAYGRLTIHAKAELKATIPNTPTLADVVYALLMDVQGIEHTRDFEEWAGDYGYDTDSREAERIYNACRDKWQHMRHLCDLDQLSELFQDY